MKVLKPEWVHHDDKPIYSIDVHPFEDKFVTGGQGNDCGRVVIWNLLPVLSETYEKDKKIPKALCQLDSHLACVNCVRWSCNGQLLASAGDDKVVMIWKRVKGSSNVFGQTTKNIENWRCTYTLRGHSGDVLDLAWSPRDRWLATCSIDNSIIIWDAQNLPSIVIMLKGHSGLVKGVTWDPVGKYLASQSDDKSVKIWKTTDWSCESTITEPFAECGGTTHILRLSWSPDGQYLVSAHAMNGGGPTAQIIEREGWKCDKDFVGHRKAVTCVRFHSSILKRQAPKTNKSQQYCCLAIGSRDRSLSVWMTALQRPLIVIADLFQDSILDISWGREKNMLLACSTDGTIACLLFTNTELGTPLTEDEKNILYQRIYGKNVDSGIMNQPGKDILIESAEFLTTCNEKVKPPSLFPNTNDPVPLVPSVVMQNQVTTPVTLTQITSPAKVITKQIEMRTKDGKRRITPMFIPMDDDDNRSNTIEFTSSSRPSSDLNMETVQISSRNGSQPNVLQTQVHNMEPDKDTLNDTSKHLDNRLSKLPMPIKQKVFGSDAAKASTSTTSTEKPDVGTPSFIVPPVAGKAVPINTACVKLSGDLKVQVQNGCIKTAFGMLNRVICYGINSSPKNSIWEVLVGSPIVNMAVCAKYVLVCSLDSTLRFLDITDGILKFPVISIPSPAIQCCFSINCELGGTTSECGKVRIWSMLKNNIFLNISCLDITRYGYVIQMHITEKGIPFIITSNGFAFSYSIDLESWLPLNSKDPIVRFGLTTMPGNAGKNLKNCPLSTIQTVTLNSSSAIRNFSDINANLWQAGAKTTFIENQIKLCESMNSPVELEFWYTMLGYHLASHGTEKRIRLLLDSLIASTSGTTFLNSFHSTDSSTTNVLQMDCKGLLTKVLDQLKIEPRWQRLYMEYMEQIQNFNSIINQAAIPVNTNGDHPMDIS